MSHISFKNGQAKIDLDRDINVYLKDGRKIEVSKIVASKNGNQVDLMIKNIKQSATFDLEYYNFKKGDTLTINIKTNTISQFRVDAYNIIN